MPSGVAARCSMPGTALAKQQRMMRSSILLGAAGALFLWSSVAGGQSGSVAGRDLFVSHCASCHGVDGRGGGPVAPSLRVPPSDLTRLTERYALADLRTELAGIIDGRAEVAAHGRREMPVWGVMLFEDSGEPRAVVEASRRRAIEILADYVLSLQSREET